MSNYPKIDYKNILLPEEVLTSFAKVIAPEIRKFYDSDVGKAYFSEWLKKHPEYATAPDSAESGA